MQRNRALELYIQSPNRSQTVGKQAVCVTRKRLDQQCSRSSEDVVATRKRMVVISLRCKRLFPIRRGTVGVFGAWEFSEPHGSCRVACGGYLLSWTLQGKRGSITYRV